MTLSPLHIAATDETPEVDFIPENGLLRMVGRSLPENAYVFYQPLIEWFKEFAPTASSPIVMEMQMDYFNSSSGRFIFEILTILESNPKSRALVTINWICDHDDELMIEKGEELKSLIDLHFNITTK